MGQTISIVDAFAHGPFTGNPAAVCVLKGPAEQSWMQSVAAEMNLAETAFLHPEDDHYRLRWFTPKVEVDLCGHATLASAHVLWTEGHLDPNLAAVFQTRSGALTANRKDSLITLNFPRAEAEPISPPMELVDALGLTTSPIYTGESFDYLVEVGSESVVRKLQPDFAALGKCKIRGIIVTARSSSDKYDFISRFFAPAVGINEDPVTGSAHCILAPYWAAKLGTNTMKAYQASERGGELLVELKNDRVLLTGAALTTLRGELAV